MDTKMRAKTAADWANCWVYVFGAEATLWGNAQGSCLCTIKDSEAATDADKTLNSKGQVKVVQADRLELELRGGGGE